MKDEPSTAALHRYWKESQDEYEPLDLFAKGMRIKADLCGAGINLGVEDDQKEPFDDHARHIILSAEQVGQVIESLSVLKKLSEDNFEKWKADVTSKLMKNMMFAHSQPVIDEMCDRLKLLVQLAQNGKSFTGEEAKRFLISCIEKMPNE